MTRIKIIKMIILHLNTAYYEIKSSGKIMNDEQLLQFINGIIKDLNNDKNYLIDCINGK